MRLLFIILISTLSHIVFAVPSTGGLTVRNQDFAYLMNHHRIGQPELMAWASDFFPYRTNGTAILLDPSGNPSPTGRSPMQAYDEFVGLQGSQSAHSWELDNHSCSTLEESWRRSCEGWWGHCNGWAAAAVNENEPREQIRAGQTTFSVADQKGILAELWLSSNSLTAGWTDKTIYTGSWVTDPEAPAYKAFWDVTPRAFFLIFTNYVGIFKQGVVIDRFTGSEIWNQPIAGYRILPPKESDVSKVQRDDLALWSISLTAKIYWANDIRIPPGHLSSSFDIFRDTQDTTTLEQLPGSGPLPDFHVRLLRFKLFLDEPPVFTADGKIISAGQIIGEGIWEHHENLANYKWGDLDHTHPDLIWLPTNPFHDAHGSYGNPFVTSKIVSQIFSQSSRLQGQSLNPTEGNFVIRMPDLERLLLNDRLGKREIEYGIRSELARFSITAAVVVLNYNRDTTNVRITLPNAEPIARLRNALLELGLQVN